MSFPPYPKELRADLDVLKASKKYESLIFKVLQDGVLDSIGTPLFISFIRKLSQKGLFILPLLLNKISKYSINIS